MAKRFAKHTTGSLYRGAISSSFARGFEKRAKSTESRPKQRHRNGVKNTPLDDIEVTASSGNVFRDLGLRNADELLAKADLSLLIRRVIRAEGLTQRQAADVIGVAPSDISDLARGELKRFSYERLIRFLVRLGIDVTIRVSAPPKRRRRAALTVEFG
jgi:predicted XRE-type DNA-binding protein